MRTELIFEPYWLEVSLPRPYDESAEKKRIYYLPPPLVFVISYTKEVCRGVWCFVASLERLSLIGSGIVSFTSLASPRRAAACTEHQFHGRA